MNTIYIASPYGFSEAGRVFLYDKLIPVINDAGINCIDPWTLTSEKLILEAINTIDPFIKKEKWINLNRIIAENNINAIKNSYGMLAVLDGTDVDSGTAAEIGFAAALNKKIVGYRGDFRQSGDNEGTIINLQVEYFILHSGGRIVFNLDELKEELRRFLIS
jgi:nucleoside 2-deoxyribosyltransferase